MSGYLTKRDGTETVADLCFYNNKELNIRLFVVVLTEEWGVEAQWANFSNVIVTAEPDFESPMHWNKELILNYLLLNYHREEKFILGDHCD